MPYIDPETLIKDLARIGLKKLRQDNQRAQWRIHLAQQKLDEATSRALTASSILGDPEERERARQDLNDEIQRRQDELRGLIRERQALKI